MTGQRTRDQRRAQRAYAQIAKVKQLTEDQQREYRALVMSLGPMILRSGLVTALALLQRRWDKEGTGGPATMLLEHLVEAEIPGLHAERDEAAHRIDQLCARASELDLEETMLATRELIKMVEWLKRAAESALPSGQGSP